MSQITSRNLGEVNQPKQHSSQTALVCNLTALDAEQRERHRVVLEQLGQVSQEVREVAKGYALRFLAEVAILLLLTEFIYLEHRCCPFLEFTLEIKTERGPAYLRVTGPEGVKKFLRAELRLERPLSQVRMESSSGVALGSTRIRTKLEGVSK